MSRIGNKPVEIESGATVAVVSDEVVVKGPKGELRCAIDPLITLSFEGSSVTVLRHSEEKAIRAKHGLYRALINNMVIGVTKGYERELFMQGIGYRVIAKGTDLEFSLGYSHPVLFKAPEGIKFTVDAQDKFRVSGIDKQLVGEVCAQIKKLRKRDAYKGKGIHFVGAVIRKKQGKSVKK